MTTPLASIIRAHIEQHGPLSLAEYMQWCLLHPEHGYYTSQQPFGGDGDFVTAPEISQLFGEMIGVWLVQAWEQLGRPTPCNLVEIGPGRARLMRQVLKLFNQAGITYNVHLVERSESLREIQASALEDYTPHIAWHDELAGVPADITALIVGNELLDALPVHQFIKTDTGWHEHLVGLTAPDSLGFIVSDTPTLACAHVPKERANDPIGSIYEYCPGAQRILEELSTRNAASLWVDYGYTASAQQDTFQAVKQHEYVDPFTEPGMADLTAHVNFPQLIAYAHSLGVSVFGPITQGELLAQLGIGLRTKLLAEQHPDQATALLQSTERLVADDQMGSLFKCIATMPTNAGTPYGF